MSKSKVVIYTRNTVENSIDVQVEKLQKYCQSIGFEVVDVVCDKRTENRLNRLELRKVIRCARKMGAKLIVIKNISRILHEIPIINRFLTG